MSDAARDAPWYLRIGAWIGVATGPGALMAGGGVAASTDGAWRWPAAVLGLLAITALAVLCGDRGFVERSPIVALSRRAFGEAGGDRIIAVLIIVGVCGWSGLYLGLSAGALEQLWAWPPALTAAALGATLWLVHTTGFRSWNMLVGITGVASVAVAALVSRDVAAAGGVRPAPPFEGPASVLFGVGVVIAYAAVFAFRAADFTWDARRRSDVLRAGGVFAAALAVLLTLGMGVYDRAGSFDLATLVNQTQRPGLGALLLVAAVIAPVVSGLHSGALSVRRLIGWRHDAGAALIAVVAAVLGVTRFDLRLLPFLSFLGAIMPPLIGVILMPGDRRRSWHGWVGWAVGSLVALALLAGGYPAHVLAGIAASALSMLALRATTPRPARPGGPECHAQ